MDPVMLRNQALNIAVMRAKKSDSLDDIKAAAEGILEWMKVDGAGSDASAQAASNPSQPSTTHESEAAVVGQEPKGE